MEDLKEIREDVKTLLIASSSQEVRLGHIEGHLKTLNGSVSKHSKRIGVLELCIKYNKGIIFGVASVISIFWTIITYIA